MSTAINYVLPASVSHIKELVDVILKKKITQDYVTTKWNNDNLIVTIKKMFGTSTLEFAVKSLSEKESELKEVPEGTKIAAVHKPFESVVRKVITDVLDETKKDLANEAKSP
jgi:hypothetical protein